MRQTKINHKIKIMQMYCIKMRKKGQELKILLGQLTHHFQKKKRVSDAAWFFFSKSNIKKVHEKVKKSGTIWY